MVTKLISILKRNVQFDSEQVCLSVILKLMARKVRLRGKDGHLRECFKEEWGQMRRSSGAVGDGAETCIQAQVLGTQM